MKVISISILIALTLIGGTYLITRGSNAAGRTLNESNVVVVDGKQIIEITAKGGFMPRKSIAKIGLPTIIRFNTSGTFDCSSSVRIPSMNISKSLPATGKTDIDIGILSQSTLRGACGMGMYPFEIEFKS